MSNDWYCPTLMPFALAPGMLIAGTPVLVCVTDGWNEIGARGSTIGAACAV